MILRDLLKQLNDAAAVWPDLLEGEVLLEGASFDMVIPVDKKGRGPCTKPEHKATSIDLDYSGIDFSAKISH